eukprot:gnl/MRDRNA2_/MRDRNA2_43455_c0_seq1.p1 gnl/MRDRNA2_/MRDRNA2_43455_c0~~gnl/MRDRNA2_/MRDRNA2_43455_c0_seq1.p1  ORF type:complete len:188 (+),score=26.00 gnl/MRDRNA2_/MRDRNA2_43455_c0_seq1:167-730(+)
MWPALLTWVAIVMVPCAQARKMKLQSVKRPFEIVDTGNRVAAEPTLTGYRYPAKQFMDGLFGAEGRKDPRWFGHNWPPDADGGGDRPARYRQDLVRRSVADNMSKIVGGEVRGNEFRNEHYSNSEGHDGARKPWQWFAPWRGKPDTRIGNPGGLPHAMEAVANKGKPAYQESHRPEGVWGTPEMKKE